MKQNVIMARSMGNYKVEQRTKDGMFNATSLLKQWNESNKRKDMNEFFGNNSTKDFIAELSFQVSNDNQNTFSGIPDKVDNQEVEETTLVASEKKVIVTTKKKSTGGRPIEEVWMHPYLFIDFAMWLNPKFKVQVIKFVYDELIKLRCEAGNNYRSLTASASIFSDVDYKLIAKGLNWIVFNKHYDGIRQTATNEQLLELNKLQNQLAFSIDMGFITNFQQLITTMRKMYSKKYEKF